MIVAIDRTDALSEARSDNRDRVVFSGLVRLRTTLSIPPIDGRKAVFKFLSSQ